MITTLFLDIGGVLGTDGWDRHSRARAADAFGLDPDEMNELHHLVFDAWESGKMRLDEYLDRVIFQTDRPFSRDSFVQFMLNESQPHRQTLRFFGELKSRYPLRVAAISNEPRELNEHRVKVFGLRDFVDFFIVSGCVHLRKPDHDIFRLALDVAQAEPDECAYVDDRALFARVAADMGMHAIHHHDVPGSRQALAELGLD